MRPPNDSSLEAPRLYVGLDIHNTRITLCVLGKTRLVVRRAKVRTIKETQSVLKDVPDWFEVCYDSSCGYGYYRDLLRPLAARVLVTHPGDCD